MIIKKIADIFEPSAFYPRPSTFYPRPSTYYPRPSTLDKNLHSLASDCVRERCKINRKLIKQDTISRSKQDLFREVKLYFVLLHIFSPFSIFK